ncbi:PAS domain-containing protein [Antarcticibacterium flavum]|uniref:PAS domain-containing protein n=1 Tax=Antarcticibacterium flavum TaxID=2058175 RepID=A0A5B7X3Y7_9FLAO|nr:MULTISPECIES: PAS domain-containing protein [Antarcticibacterium]MCM4161553.1 diguanylate cyclase [Antarcticibacterium sp. W02-3]QCY69990.1 PAS domain-containing protein [Antarcticibacterium flavum]
MSDFKDNLSNMMCLDLYLEARSHTEYENLKLRIQPLNHASPLLGLDLYAASFQAEVELGRRKKDLQDILDFAPGFNNQIDPGIILNTSYDALVLTNLAQKIQWVNKGFSKMTGYTAGFALGKTPRFLQGKDTKEENRNRIRQKLLDKEVFTEIVVNYRKTKEQYKCEITIIPLTDANRNISHFLAIEKEVA